jgi:hypothetical protein
MINDWSLRNEILTATQRWPIILAYCLAGCLIGWIVSFVWPSPHRATKELYVGLNVQRASQDKNAVEHAGVQFYNVDDYKNWQMSSLNSLIFMDDVVDETLRQLREKDSYWQSVSRDELAGNLHAYWRNAGKWRLVAENKDPHYAVQAITVWQNVVINKVYDAITASHETLEMNRQIESLVTAKTQTLENSASLREIEAALTEWQRSISQLSVEKSIEDSERDALFIIANHPELGSSIQSVLEEFPNADAPISQYNTWLDKFIISLNLENQILQNQIEILETERQNLTEKYAETSQRSLGLSPDLIVDRITDDQPEQDITRPTSLLILIGGLLGLIAWAFVWLAKISLKA